VSPLLRTRNAVAAAFALNGFCFATLVTRLPDLRSGLHLHNGSLGLLLLAISAGSIVAMPASGRLVDRFGAAAIVRAGAVCVASGLTVAMVGAGTGLVWLTAVGFFVDGAGVGIWDVSMNVEAAEVERRLGRTIMPRFHAGWSMGSIAGSVIGIPMAALHAPLLLHVGGLAVLALVAAWSAAATFLPVHVHQESAAGPVDPSDEPVSPWREPRTLAIGVMVLAFAISEGTANDWLSLGLIDGYGAAHWVGVAGFSLFVVSMTTGRLLGPLLLDRWGRAPALWATAAASFVGSILVVVGQVSGLVVLGIVVWGLGAALGFPVGMSAAADDPRRSARRVGTVSTIGYGAFLAGPPLLGQLGDRVGTLDALLAVAVVMVPAALAVTAARPQQVPAAAER
jgi:MFS family permease